MLQGKLGEELFSRNKKKKSNERFLFLTAFYYELPPLEHTFRKLIEEASRKTEKVPGYKQAYWLKNRMILVRRFGVQVELKWI